MAFFNKLNKHLKSFNKNKLANVGLTFGIAAIPFFLAGGVAIDYAKGSRAKANLQAAVDNAALAAGYDTEMTDSAMRALVEKYLTANGTQKALTHVDMLTIQKIDDSGLKVSVKGRVDTSMMRLVGKNEMTINAETTITNNYGNLEVALVLDNTGSMNRNGKLAALKNAANLLVDSLHDNKGASSELKIGIVPFAQYVNIGMSRRNALWADVPADWNETRSGSYWYRPVIRTYNCRTETRTGNNPETGPYTYTHRVCDKEYGPRERRHYNYVVRHRWHGCVGSRDYPLNTKDISYGNKIPGLLDVRCTREITTLTTSKSTIKNEIAAMNATGKTYIPAGLMWGWRMLSSGQPLTEGVTKTDMEKQNYTKAIVLMTDGENTVSPTYPAHNGNRKSTADNLTKELCQNIKNEATGKKQIRVYTVTFDVTDSATKDMMRNCATNSSYYFDASDSAALAEAFEQIGKSLVTLYISR